MASPGENNCKRVEMTNMKKYDSNEEEFSEDDNRMPLKGSRNGNWWYAMYHIVAAVIGSGVLGLPTAIAYFGWAGGTVILVMWWIITLFTLWQMVEMYEVEDENGQIIQSKTYYELGQRAFGKRLGLWIILPQQLLVFVGVDIVYLVTGGQSLWLFYQYFHCSNERHLIDPVAALNDEDQCCGIGRTTFIIFFALPQFLLAQLDGFNAIAFFSFAASVMSVCYCIVAWFESWREGKRNHSFELGMPPSSQAITNCSTNFHFPASGNRTNDILEVLRALGVVAFGFGGHNIVLEIQNTLPSSKEYPSKIRMWRGVWVGRVIVALCYFPVAFIGYWALGSKITSLGISGKNPGNGNIFLQLGKANALIAAANMMVVVHVTGSYLVYAMPAFEILEKIFVENFQLTYPLQDFIENFIFRQPTPSGSKAMMRVVTRSTYVLFTTFVACTFPFFGDLMGAFGGFAKTPTTLFLPCIIWLQLRKPKPFTIQWLINWFCIILGVLMTIFGAIGGIRFLMKDASTFTYFQFNCHNTSTNNAFKCNRLYFNKFPLNLTQLAL